MAEEERRVVSEAALTGHAEVLGGASLRDEVGSPEPKLHVTAQLGRCRRDHCGLQTKTGWFVQNS